MAASNRLGPAASASLATALLLGQTCQNLVVIMFADAMIQAGGSAYFIVWWAALTCFILTACLAVLQLLCPWGSKFRFAMPPLNIQRRLFVLGALDGFAGAMRVLASPSNRTPPCLQGILGAFGVPLTVLVHALVWRRCPTRRNMCFAAVITFGLLVSFKPAIFDHEMGMLSTNSTQGTTQSSAFWSICFMFSFVPATCRNVFQEAFERSERCSISGFSILFVSFWLNFWQTVVLTFGFWLDLMPDFGTSKDVGEWWEHMQSGLTFAWTGHGCQFGFAVGVVFVISNAFNYMTSGWLLRYTEGAVWQAMVMSAVSGLSTLFWALFTSKPMVRWAPHWDSQMTFALLGLCIVLPAIVFQKIMCEEQVVDATMPRPSRQSLLGQTNKIRLPSSTSW